VEELLLELFVWEVLYALLSLQTFLRRPKKDTTPNKDGLTKSSASLELSS
jgi:hypothetical protein